MTDELRAQVPAYLKAQGLSQAALGARLGTDCHTISRALAGNGAVPPIWQRMLDALGLELVLRPKEAA